MKNSHYEVLGVAASAPIEVIMAAQIALRQKYNPDNYEQLDDKAWALAELKRIDEACAVLLNKEARSRYDAYLQFLADEAYLDAKSNAEAPTAWRTDEHETNYAQEKDESSAGFETVPSQPNWQESQTDDESELDNVESPQSSALHNLSKQGGAKGGSKKIGVSKIIGFLVVAFLLWLIYAIASVGYDFYRMSKQANTVNPATNIAVNEPKPVKEAGLIEIETKNDLSAKLATTERRVQEKQRALERLWRNASIGAREQLSENQDAWERQAVEECQSMAQGATADERKLNQLQCTVVKLDVRHAQLSTYFKEYEAEEAARLAEEERQAQALSQEPVAQEEVPVSETEVSQ